MSQPLSTFSGTTLYLDTTTFYALLRSITPSVQELFDAIEQGRYQAFTSALTFDELAYRLLLALIRDHHPGSPLDHLRQAQSDMIQAYYPQIAPFFRKLYSFPNLQILDVTLADLTLMNQLIPQFGLRPRDALHLAAMNKCNCTSLVSEDSDFDRVPYLQRYTLE